MRHAVYSRCGRRRRLGADPTDQRSSRLLIAASATVSSNAGRSASDWTRYATDEQASKPFRFAAEKVSDVFDVLKDVASIRHNALYVRLVRQADGVAIGRTAMPHLPSSRRQIMVGAGRSNTTKFVSSIVKAVPSQPVFTENVSCVVIPASLRIHLRDTSLFDQITTALGCSVQQQSDGSWQFKNRNSGLCLDVYGAGSGTGQQLDQWPCKNAPGTNQDFNPR